MAPIIGTALVLLVLADVYLTVLYARSGTGIISRRLGKGIWHLFRSAADRTRHRDTILTYTGPTMLVTLATVWITSLIVGFALMFWPMLGSSIQATTGPTPTNFAAALYYSGSTMATAGPAGLYPVSAASRLLTALDSGIGISVITLMLTYFMQIYSALQRRNALVLQLHQATDCTGDAVEWIIGLGPGGDFSEARRALATVADDLSSVYEAHHFYGALVLFRFREPFYALPRGMLVVMDATSLICAALDGQAYPGIAQSGAVSQLLQGGTHLLVELSKVFLKPLGKPNPGDPPDEATLQAWRQRYAAALVKLRSAGIRTAADEQAGAQTYLAHRQKWGGYVKAFADYLDHPMKQVDPAGAQAASATKP